MAEHDSGCVERMNQQAHGGLGTVWVAPGEGSTWAQLQIVFGYKSCIPRSMQEQRTNLKLTGAPIQPYDRQRWESGNVE